MLKDPVPSVLGNGPGGLPSDQLGSIANNGLAVRSGMICNVQIDQTDAGYVTFTWTGGGRACARFGALEQFGAAVDGNVGIGVLIGVLASMPHWGGS